MSACFDLSDICQTFFFDLCTLGTCPLFVDFMACYVRFISLSLEVSCAHLFFEAVCLEAVNYLRVAF